MKKIISVIIAVLVLSVSVLTVCADTAAPAVLSVTISDKDGKLVLIQEEITVTDINGDGVLNIDEALYAAHEAKYKGGAEAGYRSSAGAYGLSLDKLWGTENGGSYGYYINDKSANSLSDTVKSGDRIYAYVYTDLNTWSDTYCYFDKTTAEIKEGEELSLVLKAAAYDGNYNPITVPVSGAVITVDGNETAAVTDSEGKATLNLDNGGKFVISAVSATQTLVPPVCIVSVTGYNQTENKDPENGTKTPSSPQTGDSSAAVLITAVAAVLCLAVLNSRKFYEK